MPVCLSALRVCTCVPRHKLCSLRNQHTRQEVTRWTSGVGVIYIYIYIYIHFRLIIQMTEWKAFKTTCTHHRLGRQLKVCTKVARPALFFLKEDSEGARLARHLQRLQRVRATPWPAGCRRVRSLRGSKRRHSEPACLSDPR